MPEIVQPTYIPMREDVVDEACAEYFGRRDKLKIRKPESNPFNRLRMQLFGYVIEKHVYQYLFEQLPAVVFPPPNKGDYKTGHSYDMLIKYAGRRTEVDVFTQRQWAFQKQALYYEITKKPDAHAYIFARILDGSNPRISIDGIIGHDDLIRLINDHGSREIYPYEGYFKTIATYIAHVSRRTYAGSR